jgi:uncharacterized protein (TIGR00369 family)
MDKEMMVQVVEKGCPFAQRTQMKLREIDEGGGRITAVMEDEPSNYNAFGLIHAGAMCGLAETAGGMAIFRYLDPREAIVLNTVFNIRFTSPPRGELRCTAQVVEAEAEAIMDEFRREGRADKAMDLKIVDSSGKMVAQAQATFRLIKTPEEYRKYFGG